MSKQLTWMLYLFQGTLQGGTKMTQETFRVLILDDDDDDIFIVQDAIEDIEDSDYQVLSTTSPREAEEMLSRGAADILLCDYRMGHITGIEFISKQRSAGVDIPIILLTGMNDRSTDDAALEAGASDFISKMNISPDSLDRSMRYALANMRRQRVLKSVLESVNAGVALIGEDLKPSLYNPEFEMIVDYATGANDNETVSAFVTRVLQEPRVVNVKNRVYERKVSYTNDKEMVLLLHDVTQHIEALKEREEAKNRADHLAMNCSLTGLPNRNSFVERINHEIAEAKRHGHEFFMLNMDLNKFKEVNDVCGHHTGDALLQEVANRFQSACRKGDFLARLGGDEFVAIQKCDPDSTNQIPRLAQRLSESVGNTLMVEGIDLQIGVSIGVAR